MGTIEFWQCDVCGIVDGTRLNEAESFTTPKDLNNHVNTEIRNYRAATYEAEGYTGDVYCKDCKNTISTGSTIPKLIKPVVKDEPKIGDISGWEDIKNDIENRVKDATSSSEKITITIDMNGTTEVKGDVIDAIKGKNVDLVLDLGNGIKWTINGNTITGDNIDDIDLGVNVGSSSIPVDVINTITGEKSTIQISLSHSGEFGFTATLTIGLGETNSGYFANLFFYNKGTNKLEYVDAAKIDTSGNAALIFTHALDYSIVIADKKLDGNSNELIDNKADDSKTDNKTTNKATTDTPAAAAAAPKTGDTTPIVWLFVLAMVGGVGIVGFGSKKKVY